MTGQQKPSVGGVRIMSAGVACDYDGCAVLVYNPEGPRRHGLGNAVSGCPSCGREGFAVRFGIGLDDVTEAPIPPATPGGWPPDVPCVCGAQMVRAYPNDTDDHSTTECPALRTPPASTPEEGQR